MRFPFYQSIPRKRGEDFMKKDPTFVSNNIYMNMEHPYSDKKIYD